MHKRVRIALDQGETVSGILCGQARNNRTGVIIAHGAGGDMENPFIVHLCNGLAGAGHITLRFNFPYRERGRKAPDGQKKLILTWEKVFQFFKEESGYAMEHIVVSGKSMGGRIASQMVAEGLMAAKGLVLFGYPLHAPGRKEKLRDAHLHHIQIPMLFFSGTRDSLCDLDLLKGVLNKVHAPWHLEIIQGGDHSFKTLKAMERSQEDVYDQILSRMIVWLGTAMDGGVS
ncbi:alpha/beta family hydrolase [Thermodesulfobacteriota bacterium]